MKRAVGKHWLFWGWFLTSSLIFCWILLGPYGYLFENLALRLTILAGMVAISLVLINIWDDDKFWIALVVTLIGYSVVFKLASFLPGINGHPFSLTWSEGTGYYFASLFFSEQIYGINVDLPLINPTRHMLMAIPFLVPDLPIWVHRLWEVILWLAVTGFTIYLLVRRLGIDKKLIRWAFSGWVFLYFFQGPVYYFLLISLIPILWGFDAKKFNRTFLLVLIGSAWAGASRVNWIPVPALLAVTLYFLEEKVADENWHRYLIKPVIWFASGVVAALLAWMGYAQLSGHPVGNFGIYFTSNLLWYRLLPNATYEGGVFLITILVSLPILGITAINLFRSGFNYHYLRRLGIASFLVVLFVGGMIVSTKIGGGNNIHNLDAYLLILLVTGSYLYFGKTNPDYDFPERKSPPKMTSFFVALAIITPLLLALQSGKSISLPNKSRTENALLTIQEFATQSAAADGKVLFIAERQLLTFGDIEGIPLLPEYERMNLMEMVMGGNREYLEEFYQRIENQEYALIISEPLITKYKGRGVTFGDENDVYVRQVSIPVLCYYEPVKTISQFPIQLLMPKAVADICP
ncbi:MAG: hypothetical protein MUO57_07990 [Anaerolineales bacterium]|nr:hypothetical protein [Anaerolineales bacterium]